MKIFENRSGENSLPPGSLQEKAALSGDDASVIPTEAETTPPLESSETTTSEPQAPEAPEAEVAELASPTSESDAAIQSPAEPEVASAEAQAPVDVVPGPAEYVVPEPMHGSSEIDSEDDEEPSSLANNQPLPRRFGRPSREQVLTAVAFWGIILVGALLRFMGLGDRPLHHDESLHGYFALQLLNNTIDNWRSCFSTPNNCYQYDPLLHGPFQFHIIAFVYKISQWLGAPDNGINTTTVRIAAATLGTAIVGLPYFLRQYIGKVGAWIACFLIAISPSMVYFARFAREDVYMACFTMLLVVAMAQYMRTRKAGWLVWAAVGFVLSYTTKEATFLTAGVFGSFLFAVFAWEIGLRWRSPISALTTSTVPAASATVSESGNGEIAPEQTVTPVVRRSWLERMPGLCTAAPFVVVGYFIVVGIVALVILEWIKNVSTQINASTAYANAANLFVDNLKSVTNYAVPVLGILFAVLVLFILFREQMRDEDQPTRRRGLARFVNPEKQPWLDTFVTMPWTHWFFAIVLGWAIFVILFTALFTQIGTGISAGIWQGLYYWITQQQVARGGQPWYYYFMLIPLYEQIGLIFGIVGVVRCLLHPSRFRLFLVYWFIGNVFIYTWAGEKMPWLSIHMVMPMLLLAAIGLEPLVMQVFNLFKKRPRAATQELIAEGAQRTRRGPGALTAGGLAVATLVTIFSLVLTLNNMIQLTYIHPADAPSEMMIYVQTTDDINIVMDKLAQADQKYDHGQHQIPVVVTYDATWPFAWYLRDYTHTCYETQNVTCPRQNSPVIITGGDMLGTIAQQYSSQYAFQQYQMRGQWDQGYMPPPCISTKTHKCGPPAPYVGVGALTWLSYGNNPPHPGAVNIGLAAQHIWQWWWQRRPFGGVDYGYAMGLFINKDMGIKP